MQFIKYLLLRYNQMHGNKIGTTVISDIEFCFLQLGVYIYTI